MSRHESRLGQLLDYLVPKIPGLPKREITRTEMDETGSPHEAPYLTRYYLWKTKAGAGLFLHRFSSSDEGPEVHDHPWNIAYSLVLTSGYYEERLCDPAGKSYAPLGLWRRWVPPLRINRIRGEDYHRVELDRNQPVWTLFAHGPRVRSWQFLFPDNTTRVMTEHIPTP